jgi:hypothetical protein
VTIEPGNVIIKERSMARLTIMIAALVIITAPVLHSAEVYWRGFDPKKFDISDQDFDIDLDTKKEKSFGEQEIYLEGINPDAVGALQSPHDITTPPGQRPLPGDNLSIPADRARSIRRDRPRPASIPPPPTRRSSRPRPTVKPADRASADNDSAGPTVLEKRPDKKKMQWGKVELKPDNKRKSQFKWGSDSE